MKKEKKNKVIKIVNNLVIGMPLDKMWAFFDNTDEFAKTVPTLKEYTLTSDTEFTGKVGITLGKIPIRSRLDFTITEKQAPGLIVGEGVSYLGASLVGMKKSKKETREVNKKSVGYLKIRLELSEFSTGKTLVKFSADVQAEGRLKKIYQSIIKTKVPALKQELVDNLKEALKVSIEQLSDIEEAMKNSLIEREA